MDHIIKEEDKFKYFESDGEGTPIILLHGLMGALSNFGKIIDHFGDKHKVLLPILPLFDIPLRKLSVAALVEYTREFIDYKGYDKVYVMGNSLGGHIAQLYALENPHRIKGVILTGSSGLFESAMGNTFPKRGNYEFIKKKAQDVFYDPAVATDELVDEVFNTVNDLRKAMCVVAVAKSAVRHNLEDRLHALLAPTLLVWGVQDTVTPIWVGEKFHELIVSSELYRVEKSGHAPMMERPDLFIDILSNFISRVENNTFFETKQDVITVG